MILYPNAKINLGLYVTEKRKDGFHNIETVFYPIPLKDILEINRSEAGDAGICHFTISGISVEGDLKDNLVTRAYHLLASDYSLPAVRVHLHKQVPTGAGLGGGSSDAAFMLKGLNRLFDLQLSGEKLEQYASRLGSDCAFFIRNRPVFAWGRGELMEPFTLFLKGTRMLLVKPAQGISTAKAYAGITPQAALFDLRKLSGLPLDQWSGEVCNVFEPVVTAELPEVGNIIRKMKDAGAEYVAMSGSGSAVFGFFPQEVEAIPSFPEYFRWEGVLM